jgi:hypothetical protein
MVDAYADAVHDAGKRHDDDVGVRGGDQHSERREDEPGSVRSGDCLK